LENGRFRPITEQEKKREVDILDEFSAKAYRVVAFGFKYQSKTHALDNIKDLVFGGFYGIEDAIRPEAKKSVQRAEREGVKIVMITGDLKNTAKAIAREAGIYKEGDMVITGTELLEMSESELAAKLSKVSVFARVTPEDKMKIIKAYKKAGLIIAMTGDGVNDAPSLVAADLGVAMGKIGTEVAKEAADIVLLDDNLDSIVAAIKEGRVMYENIKKALQFLFSTSMGELFVIVSALVFMLPIPITAVQILWMNLITDSLIAVALALEKEEPENHTLGRSKYFLDGRGLTHIIMVAVIMTLGGLYVFDLYAATGTIKAMTMTLTVLCIFQWFNGINCQFTQRSIFSRRLFFNSYLWLAILVNLGLQMLAVYNPFMQKILKTTALSWQDWVVAGGLGLTIIAAEEIRKLLWRINHAVFARKQNH
jgi:Ca2+-transporting ATPase